MRTCLLVLCFVISFVSHSQEKYRVIYDFKTENLSYFRLDKNNNIVDTLAKPKLKKNSLVAIEVKNVNPFAIRVQADVKEEAIHQPATSFNLGGLLGGISSLAGQDLKINSQEIQNNSGVFGSVFSTRGQGMNNKFKDLNEFSAHISALKTTLLANLSNPKMGKEDIRRNVIELSKLQNDVRLSDPEKNYYKFLTDLELIVKSDKASIQNDIDALTSAIEDNLEQGTLSRGAFNQNQISLRNLNEVLSHLNTAVNQTTSNLQELKTMYSQLEAAEFDQKFDYVITADKANVELKFLSSNAAENDALLVRQIPLATKGGFKINTSIALTLNSFGDKSKEFFINQEGVIGADVDQKFVPNLATMVNFYPILSDQFNIGGAFGVSIPLSDSIRGVNFLLGPAIILGDKNRVSITGGLAYGPVNRLTNGLEVGQETIYSSLNNFTKTVYEVGYFFGISFSLFDLK